MPTGDEFVPGAAPRPPLTGPPSRSGGSSGPHVLREYALLADGERAAVIGPTGELAWLCFPGWADEPVFTSLVGGPARYSVRPRRPFVWGGQYEEGTLVWRNRWILMGGGVIECLEALAYPGDGDRAVLIRRIIAGADPAVLDVDLVLGGGEYPLSDVDEHRGVWRARLGPIHLRWQVPTEVSWNDHAATGAVHLDAGSHATLVLELGRSPIEGEPPSGSSLLDATVASWRRRVPQLPTCAAPRDARHAVALLCGLTTGSGAMVAAATTSLPERAAEGRDYDYRYAWIRDQCYTGLAGAAAEVDGLLDAAVEFVHQRLLADGARLLPAYRTDGTAVPDQSPMDLPGYPGSTSVRSGNKAGRQFQLDAFGESLTLFGAAAERGRMHPEAWKAAEIAADAIEHRWREPDAGVWELDEQWWAHSRLTCVAGLRRVAATLPAGERSAQYLSLADAMLAETSRRCLHRTGRWQRSEDDPRVDAALLLAGIRGAVNAEDPRSVATLDAVRDQLCSEGYVYRYQAGDEPLGHAEGAFLVCGYWLSQAELSVGRIASGVRHFERSRAACGPAGVFCEEYDVHQRQLRGNFPQAFVHAALLETAALVAEA